LTHPWSGRNHTKATKRKLAAIAHKRIRDGYSVSFGRRVKFRFHDTYVNCDSVLEWSCLNHLTEIFEVINIQRSLVHIKWEDSYGEEHLYNPDFDMLISDDIKLVIECKYSENCCYGNAGMLFPFYFEAARIKKMELVKYCYANGLGMIWYHQNWDIDRYNNALNIFKELQYKGLDLIA